MGLFDRRRPAPEPPSTALARHQQALAGLRRAVAEVAAGRKRIELRAREVQAERERHTREAAARLAAGDELGAREVLGARVRLEDELADLERRHADLLGQEEELLRAEAELQTRLAAERVRDRTDRAQAAAEAARDRARRALIDMGSDIPKAETDDPARASRLLLELDDDAAVHRVERDLAALRAALAEHRRGLER